MDREDFLYNLSADLASIAYDRLRYKHLPTDEEILHMSQMFADVLKREMDRHKEE